jgi:tetratricopeptide (TPR) repeat protein
VRLDEGELFAETAGKSTLTLGQSQVLLAGGKVAIKRPKQGPTRVYAASGELTVRNRGVETTVHAGETALVTDTVEVVPERAFEDWTGGLAAPWGASGPPVRAVGELWGRPIGVLGDVGSPLAIRSQDVTVRIQGEMAETAVASTFFHGGSDAVRGDFRLAVPPGAIVSGFSVGVGGVLEDTRLVMATRGAFTDSPLSAVLEWAGTDWVRASLPSITPGQAVTVVVRYTEWLDPKPSGQNVRLRYRLPLAGGQPSPLIGELSVRVDASGNDAKGVTAGLGALVQGDIVVLHKSEVRPSADFVVDLDVPPFDAPARLYAVQADDIDYVLIRTEAPLSEAPAGITLVVVLDTSASMGPSELEASKGFVEALTRALGPRDRLAVLAANDRTAPVGPAALGPVDDSRRDTILSGLGTLAVGGGTDLGRALQAGRKLLDPTDPSALLVYVGDGRATLGEDTAEALRAQLARSGPGLPRLAAVAVGPEANRFRLASLVRDLGPLLLARDRSDAASAAITLLSDALRPSLSGVELVPGPELEDTVAAHPRAVPSGATVALVGKARGELPKSIALRWTDRTGPQSRLLPLVRQYPLNPADVARRFASARVDSIAAAGRGREAAVDVALHAGLLTPWTAWSKGTGTTYVPTPLEARVLDAPTALVAASIEPEVAAVGKLAESSDEVLQASPEEATQRAAKRTLDEAGDAVRACRESRAAFRPDLAGTLRIRFTLDATGHAMVVVIDGPARDEALFRCLEAVVTGLVFPTLSVKVEVVYELAFTQQRPAGGRCSAASELPVALRRGLWLERLRGGNPTGVYLEAKRACELRTWTEQRTLLELLLSVTQGMRRLEIARALAEAGEGEAATLLRREALRRASSPEELAMLRRALVADERVPRELFAKEYQAAAGNEARLAVVRRYLALAPHDAKLRRQFFVLLDALGLRDALTEQVALLGRDPLADAGLVATAARLLARRGERDEARRMLTEIVERAPEDPWARTFASDGLRNAGFYEDALAVTAPLSRVLGNEPLVILRTALAHRGAGRVDLAVRLLGELTQGTGRSARAELGELATELAARMLLSASGGDAELLRRRLVELPLPAHRVVLLVETEGTPVVATLVRGPATAREERPPEVGDNGVGLARFRVAMDDDVVLRLALPGGWLAPVQLARVKVDALVVGGAGEVPRLTGVVAEVGEKAVELRWVGGKWGN